MAEFYRKQALMACIQNIFLDNTNPCSASEIRAVFRENGINLTDDVEISRLDDNSIKALPFFLVKVVGKEAFTFHYETGEIKTVLNEALFKRMKNTFKLAGIKKYEIRRVEGVAVYTRGGLAKVIEINRGRPAFTKKTG